MSAGVQNFEIEQGSTWKIVVTYKANGVPMDITGSTVKCQIKTKASGDIVAQPLCSIVNPLLGSISVELSDEQTWLIPAYGKTYKDKAEYTYDITITLLNGDTSRLLNGIVLVSPGVTRP